VIATLASTLTAVAVCLALQRLSFFRPRPPADVAPVAPASADLPDAKLPGLDAPVAQASPWRVAFVLGAALLVFWGLVEQWAEHAPVVGTGHAPRRRIVT